VNELNTYTSCTLPCPSHQGRGNKVHLSIMGDGEVPLPWWERVRERGMYT